MLEIMPDSAAAGSLRVAKNCRPALETGVSACRLTEQAMHIGHSFGGSAAEVAVVDLFLDMGDIAGEIDGPARRAFYEANFKPYFGDDEYLLAKQRENLDKIIDAAGQGEALRIWTSGNAPYLVCALAFLCDALRHSDCPLSVITMPEYWLDGDGWTHRDVDWRGVPPEQFYRFLPLERTVSPAEKSWQSQLWQRLKSENAPLRALVNGRLLSVPADFYDHLLWQYIPEGVFDTVQILGQLLCDYPLGVSDWWYTQRLDAMIAQKRLLIAGVKDHDQPYGLLLKRAKA